MLEKQVEARLKKLEGWGFEVFKLRTPGKSGVMDRLILRPKWSPAPPSVVEIKKPGEHTRALQDARRNDWLARGVDVWEPVHSYEEIDWLCRRLLVQAVDTSKYTLNGLPVHIRDAYKAVYGA